MELIFWPSSNGKGYLPILFAAEAKKCVLENDFLKLDAKAGDNLGLHFLMLFGVKQENLQKLKIYD